VCVILFLLVDVFVDVDWFADGRTKRTQLNQAASGDTSSGDPTIDRLDRDLLVMLC
jgi:hypothetical protein